MGKKQGTACPAGGGMFALVLQFTGPEHVPRDATLLERAEGVGEDYSAPHLCSNRQLKF